VHRAVVAIVPLGALLSHATGRLLNATLGNLIDLVIALAAPRAGLPDFVIGSR
jgi:hypothetical protein